MNKFKKGFTLIELLIVIAILGVLAAATLSGIDPVDKINAANDSKVQSDIATLATSMEAYAINNSAAYAGDQATMVTAGQLNSAMTAPTGYSTYVITGGTSGKISGQLKSKKYVNASPVTKFWAWCSTSGKAGPVANATTDCP